MATPQRLALRRPKSPGLGGYFFGFGAVAASYRAGIRSLNERLPGRFADRVNADGTATVEEEELTITEAMGETMMVGLRMASGIDLNRFAERFGVRAEDHFASQIKSLHSSGLLEIIDGHLRLTERGLFLASEVMMRFLA